MKNLLLSLTVLVLLESILGFAPTAVSKKSVTFQPARLVHAANGRSSAILRMSDEKGESPATEEGVTREQPTGTFYDDEVDPIPASKEGISDSMRERLRREASSGLDADQKQTNILLYIMLGVAALVILGGQGIFY